MVSFSRIGCLPKTNDLSCLNDSDGIEATLQQHKAKWHDSCRLGYNKPNYRLQRRGRDPQKMLQMLLRSLPTKVWERKVLSLKHASSVANLRELVDDLYEFGLSISYNLVLNISIELVTRFVIITEWKELFVHLNSRVVTLQLVQLTTLIMTPALLVRMNLFMELGYPCFKARRSK